LRCEDPKIEEALKQIQQFILKHGKLNNGESI